MPDATLNASYQAYRSYHLSRADEAVYATSASVRRLMQLQTRTDNAVNTPHQHH